MFDEGGFGAALNSETGIVDARATLLAACRAVNRIVFCLETITQSKLKEGSNLPDW